MSNPLVDALAQMNLEPGRTYRYHVKGQQVEVRVLEELPVETLPAPLDESDAMLDPWVVLPAPEPMFEVQAIPGELPPPDLPDIPTEEIAVIYGAPAADDPIDQGDLIDGCPVLSIGSYDLDNPGNARIPIAPSRVLVLTQTCDLANGKAASAVVAVVRDAQTLVDKQLLKTADIRGPIRAARIFGWYFLPKKTELGLPEMIVDLRQLHTVRLDLLTDLCRRGQRRARVQPLYREHLAKHFADTYSRIGLPEPYETD